MRERERVPGARTVCAIVLALGGSALIITSLPAFGGGTMANAAGPIAVGVALNGLAGFLVGPSVRGRYGAWRDVRRGIRQIEMVLRLEAALSARRVPVTGLPPSCPRCGAPAGPNGPACRCSWA